MMIISDDNHTTYICDLTVDDQWGIMPNEGRNIICTARCITVNGWGSRCFFQPNKKVFEDPTWGFNRYLINK